MSQQPFPLLGSPKDVFEELMLSIIAQSPFNTYEKQMALLSLEEKKLEREKQQLALEERKLALEEDKKHFEEKKAGKVPCKGEPKECMRATNHVIDVDGDDFGIQEDYRKKFPIFSAMKKPRENILMSRSFIDNRVWKLIEILPFCVWPNGLCWTFFELREFSPEQFASFMYRGNPFTRFSHTETIIDKETGKAKTVTSTCIAELGHHEMIKRAYLGYQAGLLKICGEWNGWKTAVLPCDSLAWLKDEPGFTIPPELQHLLPQQEAAIPAAALVPLQHTTNAPIVGIPAQSSLAKESEAKPDLQLAAELKSFDKRRTASNYLKKLTSGKLVPKMNEVCTQIELTSDETTIIIERFCKKMGIGGAEREGVSRTTQDTLLPGLATKLKTFEDSGGFDLKQRAK